MQLRFCYKREYFGDEGDEQVRYHMTFAVNPKFTTDEHIWTFTARSKAHACTRAEKLLREHFGKEGVVLVGLEKA